MSPQPSMHPEDIKAALRKNGSSQTEIARALRVTQTTVFLVIHGKATSRRVASKISEVTGYPINSLWPQTYQRQSRRVIHGT